MDFIKHDNHDIQCDRLSLNQDSSLANKLSKLNLASYVKKLHVSNPNTDDKKTLRVEF